MTSLRTRLRAYLAAPTTWQIPALGVLAGCTGTILAALVSAPGFAASGLGVLLGGLAINFTSSIIGRIIHSNTSERERVRLIAEGLEQCNPDVQALAGALLGQAGADLAAALPPDERDATIATLEQGMQQAGGVLAAIGPRYGSALRDPHPDWAAFQQELQQHIATVHQHIRARNVTDTTQEAHHHGSITQSIEASGDVRGTTQRATGSPAFPVVRPAPDARPAPAGALRVFLCHASEDKPFVRTLARRLREDGFAPWLDEEQVLPGQEWRLQIEKTVQETDVFLVCLSARSVTKRGYLNREIVTALDIADEQPEGAIFIIPVRLEPCSVPDRLSRWQWVNLYEDGGYERLRAALRARAEQGRNG